MITSFKQEQLKEVPKLKPGNVVRVTVRKISSGVGVERIFPVHSPSIEKIEVVKTGTARKAKLYYTRSGQEARIKE